jgi:hypothetical protein
VRVLSAFRKFNIDALRTAVRRFPVPALLALAATTLLVAKIHGVDVLTGDQMLRTLLFCGLMGTASVSARVFAEARGMRSLIPVLAMLPVTAGFAYLPDHFTAAHVFFLGALKLSLLFAPYINRQGTDDSIWHYNYLNLIAALTAGAAALLLCLGLSALVASVDYLFELKMEHKIYGDIWTCGWFLFAPLCLLAQWADRFDFEPHDCPTPRGIRFIANYLQVPLVAAYTLLLYAYALKIAIPLALPRGNLAYMVTGFGAIGAATHLVIYPMRRDGTWLLQAFYKYFYRFMIVPLTLLAVGIWTRIGQYGLTEDRYAIVVCLLWLAGISGFFLLHPRRAHLKYVPMALAVLCLVASAGPWGAVELSSLSQAARLKSLLAQAGVMKPDGSIVKTEKEPPFALRKEISSVVDYFYTGRRIGRIAALITDLPEGKKGGGGTQDCEKGFMGVCTNYDEKPKQILSGWGMTHVGQWEREHGINARFFNVYAPSEPAGAMAKLRKTDPYAYQTNVNVSLRDGDWSSKIEDEDGKVKLSLDMTQGGDFVIADGKGRKLRIFVQPLMNELYLQKLQNVPPDKAGMMTLRAVNDGLDAALRITHLNASIEDSGPRIKALNATLLVTPKR